MQSMANVSSWSSSSSRRMTTMYLKMSGMTFTPLKHVTPVTEYVLSNLDRSSLAPVQIFHVWSNMNVLSSSSTCTGKGLFFCQSLWGNFHIYRAPRILIRVIFDRFFWRALSLHLLAKKDFKSYTILMSVTAVELSKLFTEHSRNPIKIRPI